MWILTDTEGVATLVASALEKELAVASGKPEDVYWLKKLLGLSTLYEKGTSAQIPTAEKFAKDTSEYEEVETKRNARGDVLSDDYTKQSFGKLALQAIGAMRAR